MVAKSSNNGNDVPRSRLGNLSQISTTNQATKPRPNKKKSMLNSSDDEEDEIDVFGDTADPDSSILRMDVVDDSSRLTRLRSFNTRPVAGVSGMTKPPASKTKSKLALLPRTNRGPPLMSGHKRQENVCRQASSSYTSPSTNSRTSDSTKDGVGIPEAKFYNKTASQGSKLSVESSPTASALIRKSSANASQGNKTTNVSATPKPFPLAKKTSSKLKNETLGPSSHPMLGHSRQKSSSSDVPQKPAAFPLIAGGPTKQSKGKLSKNSSESADELEEILGKSGRKKGKRKETEIPKPAPFPLAKMPSFSKIDASSSVADVVSSPLSR